MFLFQPPLTPGSNSTNVTTGLNTAGVVISSFGVGVPFIISVTIASLFFIFVCISCGVCLKPCVDFKKYVETKWWERPRKRG